jgi:hypothetical protein
VTTAPSPATWITKLRYSKPNVGSSLCTTLFHPKDSVMSLHGRSGSSLKGNPPSGVRKNAFTRLLRQNVASTWETKAYVCKTNQSLDKQRACRCGQYQVTERDVMEHSARHTSLLVVTIFSALRTFGLWIPAAGGERDAAIETHLVSLSVRQTGFAHASKHGPVRVRALCLLQLVDKSHDVSHAPLRCLAIRLDAAKTLQELQDRHV